MRTEPVEIYSDAPNAAVMRHPGRAFPGILIQGDTLNALASLAVAAAGGDEDAARDVADQLRDYLSHYASTLKDAGHQLPYPEST